MLTNYGALSYAQQQKYMDLKGKLETFQTQCEYKDISFEELCKVYKAIVEDHPELFWLSNSSSGTTKTSNGAFVSVEFRPEFRESESIIQIRSEKNRLDAKVSELISLAKKVSFKTYEQILFLHDYLVVHTDYQMGAPHCYDAYGCLVSGRAVCSGYAAAFQLLMNRLGVECGRVHGNSASKLTGEVSHSWNYIKLPDGYYFVDVTWDDPVVSNGSSRNNLSHDFFCLDFNEICLTHKLASDQVIPRNFGSQYNYYKYHGLFVERYSFDAVKNIAQKQLSQHKKFSVKFGSRSQMKTALHDLMDNQRIYSIPGIPDRLSYNESNSGLILNVYCK